MLLSNSILEILHTFHLLHFVQRAYNNHSQFLALKSRESILLIHYILSSKYQCWRGEREHACSDGAGVPLSVRSKAWTHF